MADPAEEKRAAAEATPPTPGQAATEAQTLAEARARSRRSFLGLGLAGLAGWLGLRYALVGSSKDAPFGSPNDQGIPHDLRQVLEFNGRLTHDYYRHARLAPTFARDRARPLRLNGDIGLGDDFDPAAWKLQVQGYAPAGTPPRTQEFTLADLRALPRTEMVTELKCIEGWSVVVQWAGVKISDFLARYPLATASGRPIVDAARPPADAAPYLGAVTPDGEYYAGFELWAALHPQTLLCYELNGAPLTLAHGAPLRLVSPLKYGVKHLKRIGTLAFVAERPADYWAENGYDWSGNH